MAPAQPILREAQDGAQDARRLWEGPRHRVALLLRVKHGYSHAAVGAWLAISRWGSLRLVSEAKKALRGRLGREL